MSTPITIYNNLIKMSLPFPVQEDLKDEYFKFITITQKYNYTRNFYKFV